MTMAITCRMDDRRVTLHWNKEAHIWTAKSEDIEDLNLEAESFNSILNMLKREHPEFSTSIRIFFPDSAKISALSPE